MSDKNIDIFGMTMDDLGTIMRHRNRIESDLCTALGFAEALQNLNITYSTQAQRRAYDFTREKLAEELRRLINEALMDLELIRRTYFKISRAANSSGLNCTNSEEE